MTILAAKLQGESLTTGVPSSPSTNQGLVIFREFDAGRPLPLKNTSAFDDFLAEFGKDEALQAAMASSRKEMAETVYADEPQSLSALRLKAGLSQAQLGARMATSQSYIARLESGITDPGTDVVSRLAEALSVDETTAFKAIRHQRETRNPHHGL